MTVPVGRPDDSRHRALSIPAEPLNRTPCDAMTLPRDEGAPR